LAGRLAFGSGVGGHRWIIWLWPTRRCVKQR
jgi:hypothetical protein